MSSDTPVPLRQSAPLALLVFFSMLTSTMLIPSVRPFFAAFHAGNESAMHAFMSVNMLGATLGAPLLGWLADRSGSRRKMAAILAVLDGILLFLCTLAIPLPLLLALRTLQGAANVGALSVLMAAAGRGSAGGMGLAGSAVIAAVALGAPVGLLCMKISVETPLLAGAVLAILVGIAAWVMLPAQDAPRAPRGSARQLFREQPLLYIPTLWLTAERFTVGCFVVTFSLHAHNVLGMTDADVGRHYTWFLFPFALLTWPMGRLAGSVDRRQVLALGGLVYGLCFMALGHVPAGVLWLPLFGAGCASAAIYASSLLMGAQMAPPSLRATTMALLNAGGTIGMMFGTAGAGIASAALKSAGMPRDDVYPWIFIAAGATQLVLLAVSCPAMWRAAWKLGQPASASSSDERAA